MGTFVSWSAELTAFDNAIAGVLGPSGRVTWGDKTVEYRSFDELMRIRAYIARKAASEAGTLVGRSFAKNIRR